MAGIARRQERQRQAGDADEDRHFPQIVPAPVDVAVQVAEKPGREGGEQVFQRKAEDADKTVIQMSLAQVFRAGGDPRKKLGRRQEGAGRVSGSQAGQSPAAAFGEGGGRDGGLESRGDRRVKDVVHLSGEDLGGDRRAGDQQRRMPFPALPVLAGGQYPGRPGHAAQIGKMAGKQMGKDDAGERKDAARRESGQRMEPALAGEPVHPRPEQEQMQQYGQVDRPGDRQDDEAEVGGIEDGGLESGEKGLPGIGVGIPQGQMAGAEAGRRERPPGEELLAEIGVGSARKPIPREEKDRGQPRRATEGGRPGGASRIWF